MDVVSEPFQSKQMYCSSAVMTLITSVEPAVNEQDSFQTEAAVGNILRRRSVRGQEAWKWHTEQTENCEKRGVLGQGACKNVKTIKANTNIINPVIMVQYMSSSLSVPLELLSPSTMSLD